MNKPILCLDFDGVIHSYSSGWQGIDVVADPPVPGAIEFIKEASNHFRIAIFSTRSASPIGTRVMKAWLGQYVRILEPQHMNPSWFNDIEWPIEKPSAFVTIDDRALTFDGTWPSIESLQAFKPWNKK